jgi:hypothetical protein
MGKGMNSTSVEIEAIVTAWLVEARARLLAGRLSTVDLDRLAEQISAPRATQRLLYLHCREPAVTSQVIGWAVHPGQDPGGEEPQRPYSTVLEAIADGWRAIHFPQQLAPFDDREVDIVGYEFILERYDA